MAIPDIEGIDYTTKEYLKFAQHIETVTNRLNLEAEKLNTATRWSPHKVEMAIWAHYVVSDLKPELLDGRLITVLLKRETNLNGFHW